MVTPNLLVNRPQVDGSLRDELEVIPSDGTALFVRCRFVKPGSMKNRRVTLYIDGETADQLLLALRELGIARRR